MWCPARPRGAERRKAAALDETGRVDEGTSKVLTVDLEASLRVNATTAASGEGGEPCLASELYTTLVSRKL